MIVNDFGHSHAVDLSPIEATVLLRRRRHDRGAKDESVALVHVHSKLAGAVTDEFMASAGKLVHVMETIRGPKLLKAERDASGSLRTPPPLEQPLIGELTLESRS